MSLEHFKFFVDVHITRCVSITTFQSTIAIFREFTFNGVKRTTLTFTIYLDVNVSETPTHAEKKFQQYSKVFITIFKFCAILGVMGT